MFSRCEKKIKMKAFYAVEAELLAVMIEKKIAMAFLMTEVLTIVMTKVYLITIQIDVDYFFVI